LRLIARKEKEGEATPTILYKTRSASRTTGGNCAIDRSSDKGRKKRENRPLTPFDQILAKKKAGTVNGRTGDNATNPRAGKERASPTHRSKRKDALHKGTPDEKKKKKGGSNLPISSPVIGSENQKRTRKEGQCCTTFVFLWGEEKGEKRKETLPSRPQL